MLNLTIICVTNKRVEFLENTESLLLGAVGNNVFNSKYLKCDQNDNIFFKEKYYSELTFQYWFWKNKLHSLNDSDWLGFCQRRRYWIKKGVLKDDINIHNLKNFILLELPETWKDYNSVICEPI